MNHLKLLSKSNTNRLIHITYFFVKKKNTKIEVFKTSLTITLNLSNGFFSMPSYARNLSYYMSLVLGDKKFWNC